MTWYWGQQRNQMLRDNDTIEQQHKPTNIMNALKGRLEWTQTSSDSKSWEGIPLST